MEELYKQKLAIMKLRHNEANFETTYDDRHKI